MIFIIIGLILVYSNSQLPVFRVKEKTHYDAFYSVGKNFRSEISEFISLYKPMKETLLPFYENHRSEYNQFVELIKKEFSDYYDEIRGMADGVGVEFHYIMLLILKIEILALKNEFNEIYDNEGCTDIYYHKDIHLRGHNEDGAKINKKYAYFIDVEIDKENENEHLFFFCYPGLLPGNAYGWNRHGLIFSENAVSPKKVNLQGIPTYILTRFMISRKSVQDLIENVRKLGPRAYGANINVFDLNKKEDIAMEISAEQLGIRTIYGNYSHMNNYKILNVPFRNSESTIHRQKRVDEMEWKNEKDILRILGDTKDEHLPIYRNGETSTLTTVLYNFDNRSADIYDKNPKLYEKCQTFDLDLN